MSKLSTDLGENFEYLKTIVSNRIELAKIEVAEQTAKLMGYLLLAALMLILGLLLMVGLLATLFIALLSVITSPLYTTLALIGVVLALAIIVYMVRRPLIYDPLSHFFYSRFLKDDTNGH